MPNTEQPVLFIGHGSPMNALEENPFTQSWRDWANDLPARPDAVVVISAHWLTDGCVVGASAEPETIHDFFGFPDELFAMQYACPGAPALANELSQQLAEHGVSCRADPDYGLDHGAWAVLCHMFPDADVPVLQISLDMSKPMDWHYTLAQRLRSWRSKNVLFVASGNIAHNIPKWRNGITDISAELLLDDLVLESLNDRGNRELEMQLVNYRELGDWVLEPVPHPDHYLPFIYCLGLSTPDDAIRYNVGPEDGEQARLMRSIRFG